MTYFNQTVIAAIPKKHRKTVVYYPDFMVYQHTYSEFQNNWNKLVDAEYIYTNGSDMRPTHVWRFAFEAVKGWFGFENHCKKETITFCLKKFAYYGYINNFNNDLSNPSHYSLSENYFNLVKQPWSTSNSQELQSSLLSYFLNYEKEIVPNHSFATVSNDYAFGQTFAALKQWQQIPMLDPQNPSIIAEALTHLEKKSIHYSYIPSSTFSVDATNYYIAAAIKENKNILYGWNFIDEAQLRAHYCLERAYQFNPAVKIKHKALYIKYHLEKQQFKEALFLIETLDDPAEIQTYLKENYNLAQQKAWIPPGSKLGVILADYYLHQKKFELAFHFNPSLKHTQPRAYFQFLIKKSFYPKAYELYKQKKDTVLFPEYEKKSLAVYSADLSETEYLIGKKCRQDNDWTNAEIHYFNSLNEQKKCYELDDSPENLDKIEVRKRLYATLLIDKEIATNSTTVYDYPTIKRAIKLLETCKFIDKKEEKFRRNSLTKALWRRVEYLYQQISVLNQHLHTTDYQTSKDHQAACKKQLPLIISDLKKLINFMLKNPEKKQLLAKAYYLLADIIYFFDIPNEEYNSYYRLAMETTPDNPYYILRCSECFPSEKDTLQNKGLPLLNKLGYNAYDLIHWSDSRWERGGPRGGIKNIHCLNSPTKVSLLARIGLG